MLQQNLTPGFNKSFMRKK